jgi:hypothetical protein
MKAKQDEERDGHGYTASQARSLMDQLQALRDAQPSVQLNLGHLAEQLTVPRAKTFATEALGRRLPVVERAVLNIFRIYPPGRRSFIARDEGTDIAIQLHAFAINVYALFDNIAWICALEAGLKLAPMEVGPFKGRCQAAIPEELQAYLAQPTVRRWFDDYGKVYRDSTAHRIPPYLPPRVLTPDEATRWQELHAESMRVLTEGGTRDVRGRVDELLARHAKLEADKDALGRNSVMVSLSLTGEDATLPVYLHPQLLCDWGLAHELVLAFTKAMRAARGWPAPYIPAMTVRGPF